MSRYAVVALAVVGVVGLAGCSKKKDDSSGLPPASRWGSQTGGTGGGGGGGAGVDPNNPHAGLDMSGAGGIDPNDPHAGLDMSGAGGAGGADPHAGLDMSGAGGSMSGGGNPHGGGGGDMTGGRQPDPTHFLRGTLTLDPKIASKLPANAVLFLAVKRPGASGEPEGMPVMAQLVEQYDLSKPFPFDLNEGNSMMGNVPELTGEVWILAYVDQDSNATTHVTGDLLGKVKTTVPQKDLKITIDTVLP